ncbi:unnamed protein product [Closterium sp. Naga37s-1]|nr:unnamed protein product [Closterium sp. Naga37s-1]
MHRLRHYFVPGTKHDLSASSGGKGAASTTGAGRDGAESIAEWRRRSAEAGAHFFPLQRAEDAPSRDELHRRILGGVGGGLKGKGKSQRAAKATEYLPVLQYDSTLLSTANGTLGNTMVNYSTYLNDTIRLPVYPYYVNLKLGSQKQEFSMALNVQLRHTFVPCDCLHCGTSRKGTANSKPFSTLSSTSLQYISCVDQRCQGGVESGYYGCNTEGLPNSLNLTDMLPGDDALCVFDVYAESYDYYEADTVADSFLESAGHVVEDTVYLTAPDGTEAHRYIIFGCGVNQLGYWGMQGRSTGSWTAGGVLGLAQGSPFLEQLTGGANSFAVCLDEPTPTNKTTWDGKMQQHTGSSHLTIGAVGLPAGASYSTVSYPTGLPYSHITLTTATRTLNITDDPANINLNKTSYMPADASEDDVPGFFFLPESFVHLIRLPLFISLWSALQNMTGNELAFPVLENDEFRLLCFENKNKAVDPFTTFPTIDIAFLSPDDSSASSHFYLEPHEYLAQVSASRYCVLVTYLNPKNNYASYIGGNGLGSSALCSLASLSPAPSFPFPHRPSAHAYSPASLSSCHSTQCAVLLILCHPPITPHNTPTNAHRPSRGCSTKYLFFNYTNNTLGWLQAPQCGAEPIMPPPPPSPPPSGNTPSKGATRSLSLLTAAVVVIATSTALLALALL